MGVGAMGHMGNGVWGWPWDVGATMGRGAMGRMGNGVWG